MDEVDICNLALTRIGASADIADLQTEQSPEAIQCRRIYEPSRDAMLRGPDWKFATKFEAGALIAENPIELWAYAYAYPANCLKMRKILNPADRDDKVPMPFDVVASGSGARLIYTDVEQAVLVYTLKLTTIASWDPLAQDALCWWMASQLSLVLTKDPRIRADTVALYRAAWAAAVAVNNNEMSKDRNTPGDFQRSRG